MGVTLSGYGTESPWCRELLSKYRDDMVVIDSMDATMVLSVQNAYLDFDDHVHNCRPYLMLIGKPERLEANFPFGVTAVNYMDQDTLMPVVYRYDLTRHNLAEMARKGLYEPDFEVPSIIRGNRFELPCQVNVAAMPSDKPTLPPVVFASVNQNSLRCTDITSGYEIDEYFRSVPETEDERMFNASQFDSVGFDHEDYTPEDVYSELLEHVSESDLEQAGLMDRDVEPEADEPESSFQVNANVKRVSNLPTQSVPKPRVPASYADRQETSESKSNEDDYDEEFA